MDPKHTVLWVDKIWQGQERTLFKEILDTGQILLLHARCRLHRYLNTNIKQHRIFQQFHSYMQSGSMWKLLNFHNRRMQLWTGNNHSHKMSIVNWLSQCVTAVLTQNLPLLSSMAATTTSSQWVYPWMDGRAELAWAASEIPKQYTCQWSYY